MARFIFFLLANLLALSVNAQVKPDEFQAVFNEWTNAFNHKDLAKSCGLFSKEVIADYEGVPTKNYKAICDGFKKVFNQQDKNYQYRFKLHQVYRSGNLAAVRITWYLRLYKNRQLMSLTQDEGMDILQKNSSGQWKIVNYLGYGKETLAS